MLRVQTVHFHIRLYCILIFFTSLVPLYPEENHTRTAFCQNKTFLPELSNCLAVHTPEVRMEEIKLKEISGRKRIASYLFPSNPSINGYLSSREGGPGFLPGSGIQTAGNFQVLVNQEIFTNGKREILQQIADEEFRIQVLRLESIRRAVEYDIIKKIVRFRFLQWEEKNSLDTLHLVQEIKHISKARVKEGLSPGIEESLAEAEEIRIYKLWIQIHRLYQNAQSELEILFGGTFPAFPDGEQTWKLPIEFPKEKNELLLFALKRRPEIQISQEEIALGILHQTQIRRDRVPNLTLGAFAQNDGFNERVVGGMITMPVLIWRDFSGEIEVSKAKVETLREKQEFTARMVKRESLVALTNFLTLAEELKLYDEKKMDRADSDIKNLQEAIRSGKIRLIDAINQQRILLQTKLHYINTKSEYELSELELYRVLGYDSQELVPKQ